MGLTTLSQLAGATVSVSGGTAKAFSPDNQKVVNGIHIVDTSVSDYRIRPYIVAKAKSPVEQADGSFTKDFRSAMEVIPFIDSKGKVQYDYIRVERAIHPESTNGTELRKRGAQLCVAADLDAFYNVGSMV